MLVKRDLKRDLKRELSAYGVGPYFSTAVLSRSNVHDNQAYYMPNFYPGLGALMRHKSRLLPPTRS